MTMESCVVVDDVEEAYNERITRGFEAGTKEDDPTPPKTRTPACRLKPLRGEKAVTIMGNDAAVITAAQQMVTTVVVRAMLNPRRLSRTELVLTIIRFGSDGLKSKRCVMKSGTFALCNLFSEKQLSSSLTSIALLSHPYS